MKSGSSPIQGVLDYPELIDGQGSVDKGYPGQGAEIPQEWHHRSSGMMFNRQRLAAGFPTMPVIKICGNPNTYERMINDMDLAPA